jgi:magnesium transporter
MGRNLSEQLTSTLVADVNKVSVRQNDDMWRISAWAAIAAVRTMLAGIYGMNFEHMPELTWWAVTRW